MAFVAPLIGHSVWDYVKPTEITGRGDYDAMHEQIYAIQEGWAAW